MNETAIQTWKTLLEGQTRPWVLFENGTCVILSSGEGSLKDQTSKDHDLKDQAIELMKQWGPVHAGSSAGDFSTLTLKDSMGWIVTSHHDDVMTLVTEEETGDDPTDLSIGLLGRSKRDQDAESLTIIHTQDHRDQL